MSEVPFRQLKVDTVRPNDTRSETRVLPLQQQQPGKHLSHGPTPALPSRLCNVVCRVREFVMY